MQPVLIAIGGNALYHKASGSNLDPQQVQTVCQQLVSIVQAGYLPVVTFGNGPQVGNLLDMAETSARVMINTMLNPMSSPPLDVCVAWSQGEIAYGLLKELKAQLSQAQSALPDLPVIAVNTHVLVDPQDPAFEKPSKPIGRFIGPEEAEQLYRERGWIIGPDANRGYRRLVPSPMPQCILEAEAIGQLVAQNMIVLCCGGGGIPVREETGENPSGQEQPGDSHGRLHGPLHGIEAVIDKDFTSCLLAKTLRIPNLLICTEVENVYLHFGTPQQQALGRISLSQAQQYAAEGHFASGSMGPKMAALMDYVAHGGQRALMTSLPLAAQALQGQAGTEIFAIDQPHPNPLLKKERGDPSGL